jgi:uncharacterized membrane-anchored protein YjiN (DUF445 family)
MKLIALASLVLALCGLVLSVAMGAQGAWAWVKAFSEAAAIGALADWFAVVALFRRPLGLPIKHTALIPQNKERIAESLAAFVRDHFLAPAALMQKLEVFDPAARLGEWLRAPENIRNLTGSVRAIALESLSFVNEQAVRQAIGDFVRRRVRGWDASATAADVLKLLTKDGRHNELLDGALERLRDYLGTEETRQMVAEKMTVYAKSEWPKIISLVDTFYGVDKMAGKLSEKLARQLVDEVEQALSDPDHAVRKRYEAWIHEFIGRLTDDELFSARVNEMKNRVAERDDLQRYVESLWDEVRAAIEADVRRDDSSLLRHLENAFGALGERLSRDAGLREAINGHVMSGAEKLVERLRGSLTHHISNTVKSWDDESLVQQIELALGRDLQFIRLNGTLVGGLIGVALHGALLYGPR